MKILQVCKKFPYPARDGESIAILNLAESLHEQGAEIHLIAMNTFRHFFDGDYLQEDLKFYKSITSVKLDNRIKPLDAFLNLFSKESYHIQRFISEAFSLKLKELILNTPFDVIQLETLYLAPYIPDIRLNTSAKIFLRAHNVEFEIWERITQNSRFGLKKWYLKHLTNKLRKYELAQFQNYDLLAAITERDLVQFRSLGYSKAATVIPIGLNLDEYEPNYVTYEQKLSIGFIGSLDWMPNLEGLLWFLENIWEELHQQFPALEFHIAGRNTPKSLLEMQLPQVFIQGEVSDAKAFINRHSILLVPLFSGSGMRVKILEGMALGRIVLTTSIGLEGISAEAGKEVILADERLAFIQAIEQLVVSPKDLIEIGKNARLLIGQKYDRTSQAKKLIDHLNILIQSIPQ